MKIFIKGMVAVLAGKNKCSIYSELFTNFKEYILNKKYSGSISMVN